MNINGAFPSDYLKEADLNGRAFTLTMGRVEMGTVGDDTKPILHFQGADKALALNKTNANTIAELYGFETDNWFGRPIEVYPSETDYQGKRVPCIRVRAPQQALDNNAGRTQAPAGQAPGNAQAAPSAPPAGDLDDSIPF